MTHSYKSQFPVGVKIDEGIKEYFEEFYKTSDTPDAHEKYADSFTNDAVLVMASKKGVGRDGMWSSLSLTFSCHLPLCNSSYESKSESGSGSRKLNAYLMDLR
jgi:hypothetical protein